MPHAPTGARGKRGFTLLELLVVLLVMGVMAGLVTVTARTDSPALLRLEADRLAQLLELAASESRNSGKAMSWTVDTRAYRFWRRGDEARGGEWVRILDNDLLRERTLPEGMRFAGLRIAGLVTHFPARIEFTPYGEATAFDIEIGLGSDRWIVTGSPLGETAVVSGGGN